MKKRIPIKKREIRNNRKKCFPTWNYFIILRVHCIIWLKLFLSRTLERKFYQKYIGSSKQIDYLLESFKKLQNTLPANWISIAVYHTICSRSAWGWITGVWFFNAFLVITNISRLTVWISNTLWSTSGDSIRFGN